MPRLNRVTQYGFIENRPRITIDRESGEPISAMVYVHVVRGYRDDHSGKLYMKHDFPLVIALEKKIIKEMATWKEFDIVNISGTITSKFIDKPSFCPNCTDENDKPTMNVTRGILMYVNPIFAQKERSCADKKEALERIISAREISNTALVDGRLIKDPTYFKTKNGTIVTQYQLALDRKFRIRTDEPNIRTDWPWVKSYGNQAIEDKLRLHTGSQVYIDGVVQARTVHRKTKCKCCGEIYPWDDHTLELVPYDVEYVKDYLTDELLQEEKGRQADEIRQELFGFLVKDEIGEEENTEDIDETSIEAGSVSTEDKNE